MQDLRFLRYVTILYIHISLNFIIFLNLSSKLTINFREEFGLYSKIILSYKIFYLLQTHSYFVTFSCDTKQRVIDINKSN
jgi:hypothetical protein